MDSYKFILEYVLSESNITYKIVNIHYQNNLTIYHLILTIFDHSFSKFALPEDGSTKWTHTIYVYVPDNVISNTFFMKAGSGNLGEKHEFNSQIVKLAIESKIICVEAFDIPNQPLRFNNSDLLMTEDDLMAYSWNLFTESHDFNTIVNFHMVKSVIEIIKLMKIFLKQFVGIKNISVILHGLSKRGLTTWLASSVCQEIKLIIPTVFDALDIRKTITNQKIKSGCFSPKLKSYNSHKLFTDKINHCLFDIIDPINYDKYIKIPKFIINAGNDNFFLPDSSSYYFDKLDGIKYLRYIPNVNHSLDSDILYTHIKSIIELYLNNNYPEYTIMKEKNIISISTQSTIKNITLWYSENDNFDFGINQFIPYKKVNIENILTINVDKYLTKQFQWLIYMIELTFENNFTMTSPIYVLE